MANVTRKDIENQVAALAETFRRFGWLTDSETVVVSAGSSTYGHSWGLSIRDESKEVFKDRMFPGIDMSGAYSKTEAYERIRAASNMARFAWVCS